MRTSETSPDAGSATASDSAATQARPICFSLRKTIKICTGAGSTGGFEHAMCLGVGVIRRSHQRANGGVFEAQRISFALEHREAVRMHVAQHRQMRNGRLQILAYG